VDAILAQMTADQKLRFIAGQGNMRMSTIPGIALPTMKMADGPAGVRSWGPSDAYPAGIALAATWDIELAKREGTSLAQDAHARGANVLLGPGVNIYREPMNGRNFEYMGEDPYLTSRMAVNYIVGVQEGGIAAAIKHFVGNNSEFDRHGTDSVIDERTLHEIYLPSFEAAVKEAHVAAVMDSYNLVNGEHMTQNAPLNVDLLKRQWGFTGVLMSDWNSIYDGVAAANSGLDLEMPRPKFMTVPTLRAALTKGTVSQSTIDDKVRRLIRYSLRYGTPAAKLDKVGGPVSTRAARDTAYASAAESIVLLKNTDGILPLKPGKLHRIAVIGPSVFPQMTGGGGSSFVNTLSAPDLYSTMVKRGDPETQMLYSVGIHSETEIFSTTTFDEGLRQETYEKDGFVGTPEFKRVQHIAYWTPGQRIGGGSTGIHSYRWTGVFTTPQTGNYIFLVGARARDSYKVYLDGKLAFEHASTEGTCPRSFLRPLTLGDKVKVLFEYVQTTDELNAGLGIIGVDNVVLPEAKQLAASADSAIVSVGFGPVYEGESYDRTWRLPAGQDELVKAIFAVNPKTVVVLNAGGAADVSAWIDEVPGLLHAWYSGEEGGNALRDLLFGDINPSGKLPISFERHVEDDPAFDNYYPKSGTDKVPYSEGIFLGYRYFDQSKVKPLFPFGFGLSYTTFEFGHLQLQSLAGGLVEVSCEVKNTGARAGDEVVQIYVGEEKPPVARPVKELKGFLRIYLLPGEKRRVSTMLDARAFSYWSVDSHDWKRDEGAFTIFVGDSSANVPLRHSIRLKL